MSTVFSDVAPAKVVALLTDFGLTDPFVGVMKIVMWRIDASLQFVDLTHGIPPQDVQAGALALAAAWPYLHPGTVVLGVVDPGVGSQRKPIVGASEGKLFVGPDNGLFSLLPNPSFYELKLAGLPSPSSTFHGRDIFAPAAARLASGLPLVEAVGRKVENPVSLGISKPRQGVGQIIGFDHFGNALTNLPRAKKGWVVVQGRRLPVVNHYAAVPPGEGMAVTESTGRLEIAVRDGDARATLGLCRGMEVRWEKV